MAVHSSKARAALVTALGVLCQGQLAAGYAWADAPDGGMETHHGPSLITIDNSNADSWLEVDRTANVLAPLSKGTAGSDHDGGGGAIDQNVSSSQGVGVQAAPDEQEEADEEEDEAPGQDAAPAGGTAAGPATRGDASPEAAEPGTAEPRSATRGTAEPRSATRGTAVGPGAAGPGKTAPESAATGGDDDEGDADTERDARAADGSVSPGP